VTATADQSTVPTATRGRIPGLDALRAAALLLGILLHALMPFLPPDPAGGPSWLVTDDETSMGALLIVGTIHLFRMSLFMVLAGYFGRMVLRRRGVWSYLQDRFVRILLPAVVFWPVAVLPLGILAVVAGERRGITVIPLPDAGLAGVSPGQLWFLLVLFECVVITLTVRAAGLRVLGAERAERIASAVGRALAAPYGVVLAAIPYAAAIVLQGSPAGGIIAPPTIVPTLSSTVGYLGAFAVGWWLHAADGSLMAIGTRWRWTLGLAVPMSVVTFVVSGFLGLPLPVSGGLLGLGAWLWVYGLMGVCVRYWTAEKPWVRYLADAAYWMYLMHLPLLVALEIPLAQLRWPIIAKLVVVCGITVVVLLVSYHLLVRSTFLGRWLNGHRYPFTWRRHAHSSLA
jgi:glucan biosynthesis protein C